MTKQDRVIALRLKAHQLIMQDLIDRYGFDKEFASKEAFKKVKGEIVKSLETTIEVYSK